MLLFEAAALWARERKMKVLRGPANPSLNDECGLLVDGFDSPPVLMMTYNPRYYAALYEAAGFRKAKDLLAFWFEIGPEPIGALRTDQRAPAAQRDGVPDAEDHEGEPRAGSARECARSTTRPGRRTGASCR